MPRLPRFVTGLINTIAGPVKNQECQNIKGDEVIGDSQRLGLGKIAMMFVLTYGLTEYKSLIWRTLIIGECHFIKGDEVLEKV